MDASSAILRAIEPLYAAAAEPELWPTALAAMRELLGGDHATLQTDEAGGPGLLFATAGLDERDLARTMSPEAAPVVSSVMRAVPSGILIRSRFMPDRDFSRSAFYNDLVRPLGGFHSIIVRRLDAMSPFLLNICRSPLAEDFNAAETTQMQLLLPHVTTALALRQRLCVAEGEAASFARMLDRLATGVVLTDASARPVLINARAEAILAEDDGLGFGCTGLAAATPIETQGLQDAIAWALRAGERRLTLQRPSRRPPLMLSVLPVWRLGIDVAGARAPRVAIFIHAPDTRPAIDRQAVAKAFGLTPRESQVTMLLADGLSLNEIADRLGVQAASVRQYAKRVFDKTGARSQAKLVALVRGFAEACR